jgi:hypothetical protein
MATVDCPKCWELREAWEAFYCDPCLLKETERQEALFELVRLPPEPEKPNTEAAKRGTLCEKLIRRNETAKAAYENKFKNESEKAT